MISIQNVIHDNDNIDDSISIFKSLIDNFKFWITAEIYL